MFIETHHRSLLTPQMISFVPKEAQSTIRGILISTRDLHIKFSNKKKKNSRKKCLNFIYYVFSKG